MSKIKVACFFLGHGVLSCSLNDSIICMLWFVFLSRHKKWRLLWPVYHQLNLQVVKLSNKLTDADCSVFLPVNVFVKQSRVQINLLVVWHLAVFFHSVLFNESVSQNCPSNGDASRFDSLTLWLSWWCNSSASDSWSKGRWFDSRPESYQVN